MTGGTGQGTDPGRGTTGARIAGSSAGPSGAQGADGRAEPLRPGRPLIGGGPFTLAVAFGLQADQQSQTATAASADSPAQAAEIAAQSSAGQDAAGANQLSEEEQKVVRELQQRDQEVRRHEAAHAAAGGAHAGSPTYTYQRGPDGRQYAVGGSVSIDTSPVKGDPEATLQKARQIRAAALAPADPSGQDKSVASAASALERQAQAEISAERRAEQTGEGEEGTAEPATESRTVDATPDVGGAAAAEGADGVASEQSGQTQGLGAASGPSSQGDTTPAFGFSGGTDGDDDAPVGPRQSSPYDLAGLVSRASTGFDNRTPAPQLVSISV
ncbi:putative metalloprotease CJM1_0395 family protein [Thalassobaculum sp. OXR-137]|uniref:putative metalloprotease CJM1_0395 family protein n=1 Tax=Thalassobaculum sp. OXR-137 TaxID=3100173 RepID=UPI002AC9C6B5|nr:putative metalloprotease CJM1_0395 family protein [Thalassobaculum sp. OXR-137]WPZ32812.1 putative metalloprotease CJM1_0395 family protein [Thalassobaculum sp. OXR-137]